MWARQEQPSHARDSQSFSTEPPATPPRTTAAAGSCVGSSLLIKGDITASEDLILQGRVVGTISLPAHVLTIGPEATIAAEIGAHAVLIDGSLDGNVTASDRVEIRASGRMNGDVVCQKVIMNEGSEFSGRVDMRRSFTNAGILPEGERRHAQANG